MIKNRLIQASAVLALVGSMAACSSTPKHSVGGTVSGLTGTLVLKNNGADDLSVTGNGTFTFATKLEEKILYNVTVGTSPSGQTCTVASGSGQVTNADVTSVTVACGANTRAWTYPTDFSDYISYPTTGDVQYKPVVAMNSSGDAVVTWCQWDSAFTNPSYQMFKSEFRSGTWTHPTSNTDTLSPAEHNCNNSRQSVAMDDSGNTIIVWMQSDGTHNRIYKAEYRNGAWTKPADATDAISPAAQNAFDPMVAMDNNGNAIITWGQSDGANDQIFKSEYRSGAWTHPSGATDNISPDGQDAFWPNVAMDNNGNAIIAWVQWNGTNNMIYKSEYRSGAWTHPTNLATENISQTGQNSDYDAVAMDDNGNAIIAWHQYDGTNWQIFKAEYRNGSWTLPASITDNISSDGQNAYFAGGLAMDNNGNAIITWYQHDTHWDRVYVAEYRNGTWDVPADLTENVMSPPFNGVYEPVVAMDNNGNAIVQWVGYDFNGYDRTFKAEYRSGAWTLPQTLDDNINYHGLAGREQYEGTVAMSDNGSAIMVWYGYEQTYSYYRTFMAQYK